MDAPEQRLTDLESRYSHLERLVEQLNDLVREQQDTIDLLVNQLRTVRDVVESAEPAPPHAKPPHY